MKQNFPSPGMGFKIREHLGGGNWKSAFRASSPYSLADVALLFFHDDNAPDVIAKDVSNHLRAASQHPSYASYIAKFFGLQRGEDGRFFMIEELLDRPLDRMAPINDIMQFVRIARDLSRGLVCLHDSKLVHRDLKLDNCGLDQQQRAKIFDLGSVTSEGGEVRGTVFTRAPELFNRQEVPHHCDFASDVWALGATLLALRSGKYPFVHQSEIDERQFINSAVRKGDLSREEAQKRKADLDSKVESRVLGVDAERLLKDQVHSTVRGRPEELLNSMLEFDRAKRKGAKFFDEQWSALAQELGGTKAPDNGRQSQKGDKWHTIKGHLALAERREIILTSKQIDRIISEYQADNVTDAEISNALKRIKERV